MPRYDSGRNQYVTGAGGDAGVALYPANGAIVPGGSVHAITKTSAAALTLPPPGAGDDGLRLVIIARTAFAHTVVITEGTGGKGAAFDTLTFAAVGDCIELIADNQHWAVLATNGVVIS
jgi:hypothetical protein